MQQSRKIVCGMSFYVILDRDSHANVLWAVERRIVIGANDKLKMYANG
jgi:hypothetical protein